MGRGGVARCGKLVFGILTHMHNLTCILYVCFIVVMANVCVCVRVCASTIAHLCCYRMQLWSLSRQHSFVAAGLGNASSSRRLGDNHLPTLPSPLGGSHNAPLGEDTPKSDLKRASRLRVGPRRADGTRCVVCSALSISLIQIIIMRIIINSRNLTADVTCFFSNS